jgi:hypothetical protein
MRRRTTISMLAAAAAALSQPASGAFLAVTPELVAQPTIAGVEYDVYRVYVEVSSPSDTVELVSGNAANPVLIAGGGVAGFYQNTTFKGGGGDFEPNSVLFALDPDLEWDTFVTIGTPVFVASSGPTQFVAFDTPGFQCDRLMLTNGGWYRVPGDPLTAAGDDLRVLIGQFTIPRGAALSGSLRVTGDFDGVGEQHIAALPLAVCPPDVNADRMVDVDDLISVILGWGACSVEECPCPDVNRDGAVDVDDLIALILAWGPCGP